MCGRVNASENRYFGAADKGGTQRTPSGYRAKMARTRAVTIGIVRLSSTKGDEKNSANVAAPAAAKRAGILKEKHASMKTEERKNETVPSADLPRRRRLPHRDPMIDDRGSDTASTKIEATAVSFPKRSMTRRQETIYKRLAVGFFISFSFRCLRKKGESKDVAILRTSTIVSSTRAAAVRARAAPRPRSRYVTGMTIPEK